MIRRSRCAHILVSAVALAATLPLRTETTGNILINPGAETSNLAGWTIGGSSNPRVDNGTFDSGINPLAGAFDFLGGSGASGTLSQPLNFNGFAPTFQQIDNGQVAFNLGFAERSLSVTIGTPDGAGVALASNGPTPLNFVSPEDQSTGGWQGSIANGTVPSGARNLTYTMYFNRHSGTDLDAFIDSNSLSLSYPGSSWKGSATGNWSNASLWNSLVPTGNGPALLTWPGGPVSVTFDANYPTNNPLTELYLDAPGSGMSLSQNASNMSASTQYIGNIANATYSQNGGTNNAGDVYLGFFAGAHGNYTVTGGQLNAGNSIHIGHSGTGTLSLSGTGAVSTISTFIADTAGSTGALNITGGTFNTFNLTLGPGAAQSTVDGGTLSVANSLAIPSGSVVNLTSGNLSLAILDTQGTPSRFHWTGGTLTFVSDFAFQTGGSLGAAFTLNHNQTLAVLGLTTIVGSGNLVDQGAALLNNVYIAPTLALGGSLTLNDPVAALSANNVYVGGTAIGAGGVGALNISSGAATIQHLTSWLNGTVTLNGGTLAVSSISGNGSLVWTSGTLRFLSDQTIDPSFFFGPNFHLTGPRTIAFANLFNNGTFLIDAAANLTASVLSNEFAGTLIAAGRVTLTGAAPSTNIGTINISGPFQTNASFINYASLTLSGPQSWAPGATLANNAGTTSFQSNAKLYGLPISGGTVDITNSKLIIEPADKSATLAALRTYIANHSLTSSTLPANFALALLDNVLLNLSTFGGQPVDSNSLLLSPELLGDANIDGHVDLTDLATILNHFGTTTPNWTDGNFDNASAIDLADLSDLLNNFGLSNPNSPSQSSSLNPQSSVPTPEPTSLLALFLFAPTLLGRRKR